jgi:hypothetical protein
MLGGARIVRVVVLQESRMTVSPAMPPVHQRIFSRFSQNRWMSFENLTSPSSLSETVSADYAFLRRKIRVLGERSVFSIVVSIGQMWLASLNWKAKRSEC